MRKSTVAEYEARVREAIRFVLERLDQPPSPAEVADKAGFSRHHFGRVFSGAVGESIAEFVRRLRLERAAHRLEHTDQSVSEIALDAGYDSLEAFSRAFRSAYLMARRTIGARPAAMSSGLIVRCIGGRTAAAPSPRSRSPRRRQWKRQSRQLNPCVASPCATLAPTT